MFLLAILIPAYNSSSPTFFIFSCKITLSIALCCVVLSHSVMSDSLGPHGLYPTRLLYPWDFPGKNPGVGSHFLLQGNPTDPGIEVESPSLHMDSLVLSHQGSPVSFLGQ